MKETDKTHKLTRSGDEKPSYSGGQAPWDQIPADGKGVASQGAESGVIVPDTKGHAPSGGVAGGDRTELQSESEATNPEEGAEVAAREMHDEITHPRNR